MPQFKFHFRQEDKKIFVKTIVRSRNGEPTGEFHAFPKTKEAAALHAELMAKPIVKSQLKGISNLRNIAVTLTDAEAELYTDEEGNFSFKDEPLEECADPNEELRAAKATAAAATANANKPLQDLNYSPNAPDLAMQKKIEDLEAKLNEKHRMSIKKAKDNFAIGDFDGKTNGADYLIKFEKECDRYEVKEDERIKVFGDFCKGRAAVWYAASEKMLDPNWTDWKASFKSAFGQKGWSAVRAAFAFRHISGSVMEYALQKQKLFAEINPKIGTRALIDAIAVGLPFSIQNQLEREELATLDKFYEKLQHHDDAKASQAYQPNRWQGKDQSKEAEKPKNTRKEEDCKWCELMGYPGRKHPSDKCRVRLKAMQKLNADKREVNLVEPDEADDAEFAKLCECLNLENESKNSSARL